ncbi:hypothetical protein [Ulvibacter antarcticus]|nr:hypothetical protein [Ulvibacter antarcticus]
MAEELRKTLTEAQIALLDSMPGWYDIAFGIGVFAGLLGCILLLMRKKMAIVLFALSLLAVFIYMGYWVIGTDATKVYGMEAIVMPLVVIAGCIFLYFYSKGAARNGWLT